MNNHPWEQHTINDHVKEGNDTNHSPIKPLQTNQITSLYSPSIQQHIARQLGQMSTSSYLENRQYLDTATSPNISHSPADRTIPNNSYNIEPISTQTSVNIDQQETNSPDTSDEHQLWEFNNGLRIRINTNKQEIALIKDRKEYSMYAIYSDDIYTYWTSEDRTTTIRTSMYEVEEVIMVPYDNSLNIRDPRQMSMLLDGSENFQNLDYNPNLALGGTQSNTLDSTTNQDNNRGEYNENEGAPPEILQNISQDSSNRANSSQTTDQTDQFDQYDYQKIPDFLLEEANQSLNNMRTNFQKYTINERKCIEIILRGLRSYMTNDRKIRLSGLRIYVDEPNTRPPIDPKKAIAHSMRILYQNQNISTNLNSYYQRFLNILNQ